ncbi:MAG: UbiH/UbiF/VisC/COQ6 family ubiquinone biosynthesis hydroxylase [Azospirillaceae bacterium]
MAGRDDLRTDIAIVGGGLAGLTLALGLARAGIGAVVVDRVPLETMAAAPFDGRSTAISFGSRRILERVGLWPRVAGEAAPILDIRIADDRQPLFLHFDHEEMADRSGGEPFGHIVDNRVLRRAQFEALAAADGVRHLAPATVTGIARGDTGVKVTLADGRHIGAELVVGADGRRSAVRESAGIRTRGWSYAQHAIVGCLTHEKPHDGLALEHFLPEGPFAVLPMTDDAAGRHRSSLVWTETPARADHLLALDDAAFDRALNERLGDYLGPARMASARFRYPLTLIHARRYVDRRLALISEAAHGIHPIAGQGLNLGLRDIDLLLDLVGERARLGLDLGDPDMLARYEARRRPDNTAMAVATDLLNRLFSNRIGPVRRLRGLGLEAVGMLPPVKRFFMAQAMGLSGREAARRRGWPAGRD